MAQRRLWLLAGVVLALALLLVAYEQVLVFLGTTGALPSGLQDSPMAMVVVPLLISLTLVAVLVGAALLHAETLR